MSDAVKNEPRNQRDCKHGQLARACDKCADEREIAELRAELLEGRDCRTCRNFRGTQHCHSVLRCIDGSSYQRGGVVQLWEAAPLDPSPF